MRGLRRAAGALPLLLATACAGRDPGPVVSPTGVVYEPGIPPTETRRSQTATLYLRQDRVERALELALEGVADDPDNPVHFFLAGVAHARLDRYEEADRMFAEAQRLYPAYELDIEPERLAAWAVAFNAGLETYAEGALERTIELWRRATSISDLRPEAHRNLGSVLASEGRYAEAIEVYLDGLSGLEKLPVTRVLDDEEVRARADDARDMEESLARLLLLTERFAEAEPLLRRQLERRPESVEVRADLAAALSGQGRDDEARAIYSELLSEEGLAAAQLSNLAVALFRSEDYLRAADAFGRLTGLRPDSRDAWFNYANALFAAEAWEELAVAGERLVALDPLSENAYLISARARLEAGDRAGAVATLALADSAEVLVADLQLRRVGGGTSVQGRITGNAAEAGAPVTLRFVFYDDAGDEVAVELVEVVAPAAGETASLAVATESRATSYRYEVVR